VINADNDGVDDVDGQDCKEVKLEHPHTNHDCNLTVNLRRYATACNEDHHRPVIEKSSFFFGPHVGTHAAI
jgi:hypothetical protein